MLLSLTFALPGKQATATEPLVFNSGNAEANSDWPFWRGPQQDGIADDHQQIPLEWSASKNIAWQAALPGKGHGSPIVVGERVYLATATDDEQLLLCFDRNTGEQVWQCVVHHGGLIIEGNQKASLASSTPACDGEQLYINFLNNRAVYTSAVDLQGKLIWQTKVTDYVVHQGYGSSPTLFKTLVIVTADNKGGGAVAALDRATGEIAWRHGRAKKPNYVSPVVRHVDGKDQLLLIGTDLVGGLDPLTGKVLWERAGATTECVATTVTDGQRVFTSGGYPDNHVAAVQIGGEHKTVWENKTRVYVPSMIAREGYLYAVGDAGVVYCWKSDNGSEQWKLRLSDVPFTSSPVLVGDKLLVTDEKGTTYVIACQEKQADVVAKNHLGELVYASPAICGGQIFLRYVITEDGERKEFLACIAEKKTE
jgi:outer membrane protein assembly factor BamB